VADRRGASGLIVAERAQLGLEQAGEVADLGERVRVGVAAEEQLVSIADHPDGQRVPVGDGHDRVDLLQLKPSTEIAPRGPGDCEMVRLNTRGEAIALTTGERSGAGNNPPAA